MTHECPAVVTKVGVEVSKTGHLDEDGANTGLSTLYKYCDKASGHPESVCSEGVISAMGGGALYPGDVCDNGVHA